MSEILEKDWKAEYAWLREKYLGLVGSVSQIGLDFQVNARTLATELQQRESPQPALLNRQQRRAMERKHPSAKVVET